MLKYSAIHIVEINTCPEGFETLMQEDLGLDIFLVVRFQTFFFPPDVSRLHLASQKAAQLLMIKAKPLVDSCH